MSIKRLIVVFATLFLLTIFVGVESHAEEGNHVLGVQAGHVGLSGDVGTRYGNALGYGVFFDYAASDFLEFELSWTNSRHTQNNMGLGQNVFGAAIIYDVDQFDLFIPQLKAGAEFISSTLELPSPVTAASYSTTGFGLAVGVGGKFMLGSNFMTGLDLTYHSAFDASVTPTGSASSVKAIQSFMTVMLKLGYVFDETGKNPNKTF